MHSGYVVRVFKLFFMLKRQELGTLVHEGWVRMAGMGTWRDWPSRVHFTLALGRDFTKED